MARVMQKHRDITLNRIEQFNGKNHLLKAIHETPAEPIKIDVSWWEAPDRVPFSQMLEHINEFQPISEGHKFAPIWSTHWLKLQFHLSKEIKEEIKEKKEKKLILIFDFGGESLIWSKDGRPLQGLNGQNGEDRRDWYIVYPATDNNGTESEEEIILYLECACNELFGNSVWNVGPSAPSDKDYSLKEIKLVFLVDKLWKLLWDYTVIVDTAKHQDKEGIQSAEALRAANEIVNNCDLEDLSTIDHCLELTEKYFKSQLANRGSGFELSAIGHCHIDTAWLWTYDETKRKCARSWASQLRLMENYPDYKFVCSQPSQLAWLKEFYPSLFVELVEKAKNGQFVPIGGSWVEMDCNIPSGESMVRQFLYGQRFLKEEFGSHSPTFWLPDTFGYAAQLPQIMKQANIKYFLTQKLSWNQINKFPHNTFIWEGIDGSQVLTHFPPADTYCSHATVSDLRKSEINFKDRERSNEAMLVFGHGDGGGGPNPKMIEMLERTKSGVALLPSVTFRSPNDFFDRQTKIQNRLCTWIGELYFEYHRGTYTTQAFNKLQNRKGEQLLKEIEFFSILAKSIDNSFTYPSLEELWKLLLLNQFHDVIPGTSIPEVYKDSRKHYQIIQSKGNNLKENAIDFISSKIKRNENEFLVFNSLPFDREEVVEISSSFINENEREKFQQSKKDGLKLFALLSAPSTGYSISSSEIQKNNQKYGEVKVSKVNNEKGELFYLMENDFVKVKVEESGHISSLYLKSAKKELIQNSSYAPNSLQSFPNRLANHFVLFDDHPLYWDAWDVDAYHLEKRKEISGAISSSIIEIGPITASIEFHYRISSLSTIKQQIKLNFNSPLVEFDNEVDWHENHKFLKVEFPLNIRTNEVTYEIPFGYVKRPNHFNTSWDLAKFEVCGHRFADLSEFDFGVALLNDSKYGYSARSNLLTLSLLRSAKSPDDTADMGDHHFRYALLPHSHLFQHAGVVQSALSFNFPLSLSPPLNNKAENNENIINNNGEKLNFSLVGIEEKGIILEVIKKAEDDDGIILRFYESFGGSSETIIHFSLPISRLYPCNLLEEITEESQIAITSSENSSSFSLSFSPFQIISLKLFL